MEYIFFDLDKYQENKKRLVLLWILEGIGLFLIALFVTLCFLLQNRQTGQIWIWSGTIIIGSLLTIMAYIYFKMILPLKSYRRAMYSALSRNRVVEEVIVQEISTEETTRDGFITYSFAGMVEGAEELSYYYYESSGGFVPQIGKRYEVESRDGLVARIKEL